MSSTPDPPVGRWCPRARGRTEPPRRGPVEVPAHHAEQASGRPDRRPGLKRLSDLSNPGWLRAEARQHPPKRHSQWLECPFHPSSHGYTQRRSPALRPHTYLPAIRDSVCGSGATPRARYDATSGERGVAWPGIPSPGVPRAACGRRRLERAQEPGWRDGVAGGWEAGRPSPRLPAARLTFCWSL